MKHIKIISFCVSILIIYSVNVKGQDVRLMNYEVYNESCNKIKKNESGNEEEISLALNYNSKEFEIFKNIHNYDMHSSETIHKGSFIKKGNKIICNDPFYNKKYELKIIDNERLLVDDLPYLKDTLYITLKAKDGYKQFVGKWRNGKKYSSCFFFRNGRLAHTQIYRDGVLVETKHP